MPQDHTQLVMRDTSRWKRAMWLEHLLRVRGLSWHPCLMSGVRIRHHMLDQNVIRSARTPLVFAQTTAAVRSTQLDPPIPPSIRHSLGALHAQSMLAQAVVGLYDGWSPRCTVTSILVCFGRPVMLMTTGSRF